MQVFCVHTYTCMYIATMHLEMYVCVRMCVCVRMQALCSYTACIADLGLYIIMYTNNIYFSLKYYKLSYTYIIIYIYIILYIYIHVILLYVNIVCTVCIYT